MATEKIQLEFGGRYTAKAAFAEGNADIKAMQRATGDMVNSAKKGLSGVAGMVSGELGGSLRGVSAILETVATGGVWGLMAGAVTMTIGYFQRLRKEAEEHAKQMVAMGSGYRALIEAQLAAKEAEAQKDLEAQAKAAMDAVAAINSLQSAYRGLAAASDAAIGAQGDYKVAQINADFSKRLAEADDALKPLINAERSLAIAMQRQETAREQQARAVENEKSALVDIEHKIARQKEAIEAATAAGKDTAKAEAELANMKTQRAAQLQRIRNAETAAETAALNHESAVRDATAALNHAKGAWEKTVAANEAEMDAAADKAYMDDQVARIMRVCAKNQLEANDYIRLFRDSLEKGMTETEAYASLQNRLNADLEKKKDGGAKDEEEKAAAPSAVAQISFDPERVTSGVERWDKQTSLSRTYEQMHTEQRNDAQERKRERAEIAPFIGLLKGNYPETLAQAYREQLIKDYSAEQLEAIYAKALKAQLLSTAEQKEQLETLKGMLKAMEKQGLK